MATMGVAHSDSGEEEGSKMKNRAATPPLFYFCFFLFPVYFSLRCLPPFPPPPTRLVYSLEFTSLSIYIKIILHLAKLLQ